MAIDLAIDNNSGDLMFAPNQDLATKQGIATIEQRIRVRLRTIQGTWDLDPDLGSRVLDATRMPVWRALDEIPLVVKEALEPMDDIIVSDVVCAQDSDRPQTIGITIKYNILDTTGAQEDEDLSFGISLTGVS